MPETTPNQQAISAFQSQMQNLANISPESLVRRDLGQANFQSLFDEFKAMQVFAQRAAKCSWIGVPTRFLGQFSSLYNNLISVIQPIQTFTVMRSGVDLPSEINRCVANFQTQWNTFYSGIVQHLTFAESNDTGTANFRERLDSIITDAGSVKAKLVDELNKLKVELETERAKMSDRFEENLKLITNEINGAEERIKNLESRQRQNLEQLSKQQEAVLAADRDRITKRVAELESSTTSQLTNALEQQKRAVEEDKKRMDLLVADIEQKAKGGAITKQSEYFKKLADRYSIYSILWLLGSLASGWVLYKYIDKFQMPSDTDHILLAEHLVPRLVTVTLLSTALIFCIRNFSAMMHNLVVNRHRQTALTTFQVFVEGTSDPGTKNAVLVQSTQAIFAPQPSGYLKTDQEMPQMNQVTEIVKSVTGKEK
jgi:hypothetical protein